MWWNFSAGPVVFQGPESSFLNALFWQFINLSAFITFSHKQYKTCFARTCGQEGIQGQQMPHEWTERLWCFHGRALTEVTGINLLLWLLFSTFQLLSELAREKCLVFLAAVEQLGVPSASAEGNEISRVPGDKLGTEG